MFSYQCSQLSTSESVLEVFGTATKFQKNKDISRFVSVVVLDEVGLAEDSPSLPLKVLHPLLEDGTSGADSQVTITYHMMIITIVVYYRSLIVKKELLLLVSQTGPWTLPK